MYPSRMSVLYILKILILFYRRATELTFSFFFAQKKVFFENIFKSQEGLFLSRAIVAPTNIFGNTHRATHALCLRHDYVIRYSVIVTKQGRQPKTDPRLFYIYRGIYCTKFSTVFLVGKIFLKSFMVFVRIFQE